MKARKPQYAVCPLLKKGRIVTRQRDVLPLSAKEFHRG
jgi:hypothetical protein